MDDLEEVTEGLSEEGTIFERVLEPDELLEDLVSNTLMVVFAVLAGLAALLTLLFLALTVVLLAFSVGPAVLVVGLATIAVLSLFVTVLAVGGFLYLRPDIPSAVRQKIDHALTSEHPERVVERYR